MMKVWALTDTGLVRHQNQDAYGVETVCGRTVAVVCDGMGGPRNGDVASNIAVGAFLSAVRAHLRADMTPEQIREMASYAVSVANMDIRAAVEEHPAYAGMGTTLVSAVSYGEGVVVSNVGDSRAYLIRGGGDPGEAISRITRDHSLVERLVEKGAITPEEARTYPGRNLITRALGPDASALSDSYQVLLDPGDCLLLCTDGLITTAMDHELEREILQDGGTGACLNRLLEIAKERGAPDNVTAVLLRQQ